MTLEEYFAKHPRGEQARIAKILGISRTWMSLLVSLKRVPSARLCVEIQRHTGVKRKTLRPDIFGEQS